LFLALKEWQQKMETDQILKSVATYLDHKEWKSPADSIWSQKYSSLSFIEWYL
jgi:hypothetical protein